MSPTLLLVLVATMCFLHPAAAVTTLPLIQTDHTMGIQSYSFLIDAPQLYSTAYELRVYLRTTCKNGGKQVHVRGFAGAFPLEGTEPTGLSLFAPHFQPPALHQHKLQVLSAAANRTTSLKWLGPSNQGLWRFDGKLAPAGREVLTLQGSMHTHQLVLPCAGPASALVSAQHPVLPQEGTWNVITTTSANKMTSDTLAHLLSLHMQYHARLGFNGTILRCNKGEAQELAVLPHIETLVASRQLVIWPWVSRLVCRTASGQSNFDSSYQLCAASCIWWQSHWPLPCASCAPVQHSTCNTAWQSQAALHQQSACFPVSLLPAQSAWHTAVVVGLEERTHFEASILCSLN